MAFHEPVKIIFLDHGTSLLCENLSVEFLQHEVIIRQFLVDHLRAFATLFKKDSFELDLSVNSINVSADKDCCTFPGMACPASQ